MSYIEPNTDIVLFSNTSLSPSYENTLYFATEDEKNTYWNNSGKISARFPACTYQRSKKGIIRVESPIKNIYQCDYMRFRNNSFENKYFYAFVLSVNYVNNTTCEIQYMLDPLMTWMGNFGFKQCLVLRQHQTTDNFGDNIKDEGIQLGEYVIQSFKEMPEAEGLKICICVANEGNIGSMVGGVYSGAEIKFFNGPTDANAYIDELVGNNLGENIVSIFMCPAEYADDSKNGKLDTTFNFTKTTSGPLNGYTPKNKKLYTYPYVKLIVANGDGSENTYRQEFFSTNKCTFRILSSINTNVQMACYPQDYKGISDNYEEVITKSDFPTCAWNYDTYKAWLAQYNSYYPQNADLLEQTLQTRTGKTALSGLASIFSGGMSSGTGQYLQEYNRPWSRYKEVGNDPVLGAGLAAVGAGVNQIANGINNILDREQLARERKVYNSTQPVTPQTQKGKAVPNAMNIIGANLNYKFYEKVQNAQNLRVIDDYFTMYGYTINEVGIPNMNARPYYTYVKTDGCNITGNIPVDDMVFIEGLFDNGIRFWKNLDNIGNYNLDNSPR